MYNELPNALPLMGLAFKKCFQNSTIDFQGTLNLKGLQYL